jgi:hypothetical protein
MHITRWQIALLALLIAAISALPACNGCNNTPTTTTTSVGKSVATLVKTSGLNLNTNCQTTVPPPPDVTNWWNTMPAANHQHPFAGWETWRNTPSGCSQSRIDAYRALVTFNTASVSNLKGLVQKAQLVVSTRALPPAAQNGGVVTAGPFGNPTSVTLVCPALLGGAGTLQRFGPAAATTLPTVSTTGDLHILTAPEPFPAGQVVYTFPPNLNSPGPVNGATDPTVVTASGNGGSVFTTDVTSQVTAALNGGASGMSWMLTANFEGPLPGTLPVPGSFDCKTSYDFDLQITHF